MGVGNLEDAIPCGEILWDGSQHDPTVLQRQSTNLSVSSIFWNQNGEDSSSGFVGGLVSKYLLTIVVEEKVRVQIHVPRGCDS